MPYFALVVSQQVSSVHNILPVDITVFIVQTCVNQIWFKRKKKKRNREKNITVCFR